MKDQLLLLVTAIACSVFATVFFRVTGEYSTFWMVAGLFITIVVYIKRKRR